MRIHSPICISLALGFLSTATIAQPHFQYAPPPPLVHPIKGYVHAPSKGNEAINLAAASGAGPHRSWVEGDQVPTPYRSKNYMVKNWQAAKLDSPAKGQRWLRYGSDYMLVDTKSGAIAQLVRNP